LIDTVRRRISGALLQCSKGFQPAAGPIRRAGAASQGQPSMSVKPKTVEAGMITEEAVATATKGIEATVTNLKEGMTKAAAGFTETQAKVKEGMEKAMKTAEELVSFGQGNFEAILKSGQIWASGMQDLSKQMAATAQASFDETLATFKALTSVKSLKDAMELQASLARSAMEKTLTESGKLTDASFKLTEQAIAPITARVTLAVEKFAKSA
jgi:phasin family protein